jgi:UDP-N-acetyl-D-mannosaminuronic acid dehydrogenase
MNVCTIGLGYIGLPTSALMADNLIRVHGVDINQSVVETINQGKIHILEEGLEDVVKKTVESGYFKADTKAKLSDVYLVVVPTPFSSNYEPDISYIKAATESIVPLLKEGDLYIIESTSPIGTTEKMARLIASKRPDLLNNPDEVFDPQCSKMKISIAYCPERVLPGNVMYELVHNDRVIGGLDKESTDKACEFYSTFVKGELHKTNSRTAEMCKLTENASRDVQIAFANELSIICDKADVDPWELIHLANKHPRVNILQPGCGVGGHCIAVDPWFIVSDYPLESRMIASAREINNHKAFWCADKIKSEIKSFELKKKLPPVVAIMGLAFKPNIDDLRESPAKYIAMKVLQTDFGGEVLFCEPNIEDHENLKLTHYTDAYNRADIVAFLVAHDQFKTLSMNKEKVILDFCGVMKN